MNIVPLSEGRFTIDATKIFIPFNENDNLQNRPKGSLLVEIQPFALQFEKETIILDTGLGFFNHDGVLQIHQNLLNHHIRPEEVTKVLLSHLHKDHAGGISYSNGNGQTNLTFPNATYYICKKEWEYAVEKGYPSYHVEDFLMLESSGRLVFLNENSGQITNDINYEISGGHCPYHIVFNINNNGKEIFFGGDEAPQLHQMKSRIVAKYDYDGKKSSELRTKWWEVSGKDHWTLLFYHDIQTPFVRR